MKRHAPAALRNRGPILEVIRDLLPTSGTVLEIASGSGEHVIFFAEHLPGLHWQPSDVDPTALASVDAHVAESGLGNVNAALRIDVQELSWPLQAADALICSNMIHISPWASCEGLVAGASRLLSSGAPLILYGPYRFDGAFTAPSNEAFDQSLRQRDPRWGVRDLGDVTELAERAGFDRGPVHAMPANNHVVVFHQR